MRMTVIILDMGLANKSRRYILTSSLIRWAHTQDYRCNHEVITVSIANQIRVSVTTNTDNLISYDLILILYNVSFNAGHFGGYG